MRRAALVLGLLLLSLPAASQQVPNPMAKDAANATLPAARDNLELGTVKSLGGDPPDAITRFYTWDKVHPQFQINAQPEGNEWTVEQAGQTGGGTTRLCWSTTSTSVDCNYAAFGLGRHVFGNGAGNQLILDHFGEGQPTGYVRIISGDDELARVYAESPLVADVGLYLKAQGGGIVTLADSVGKIATFNGVASDPKFFSFTAGGPGDAPAIITSNAESIEIHGLRPRMATKVANYSVTPQDSGTHFDNIGATGTVVFTLPVAARNYNYCFTVDAAFTFRVLAHDAADKISIGGTNSLAGGNVQANAPYAGLCIKAHKPGQWVTTSTPDKAQWTVN